MNDDMVLETVFDADPSDEMMDLYSTVCNVLSGSTLSNAEICTALMWVTGYFLAERTGSGCLTGMDLKELQQILNEYYSGLEDTSEKATIAMRDSNFSRIH